MKLNDNLILIYTSIKRDAQKVASSYINKLNNSKKKYIEEIINHSIKGEKFMTPRPHPYSALPRRGWKDYRTVSDSLKKVKTWKKYWKRNLNQE